MTDQEFVELILRGYETRGVEFKGPGRRDDSYFFAKVTRAVLGMANTRDGGLIAIGIESSVDPPRACGLSLEVLATWNYDDVTAALAPCAEPTVRIDIETRTHEAATCIVIHVHEFDEIPILCNKGFDKGNEHVLRKGACYVRGHKKPETSEIPSQEEMRALLDLATEKGMRRLLSRAYGAGLLPPRAPGPSAAELYRRELGDLA